jgi:hypothetical protein
MVRLEGAVDFANYGAEGIWFAILPAREEDKGFIDPLFRQLVPVANRWNASRGYPPFLNKHYT